MMEWWRLYPSLLFPYAMGFLLFWQGKKHVQVIWWNGLLHFSLSESFFISAHGTFQSWSYRMNTSNFNHFSPVYQYIRSFSQRIHLEILYWYQWIRQFWEQTIPGNIGYLVLRLGLFRSPQSKASDQVSKWFANNNVYFIHYYTFEDIKANLKITTISESLSEDMSTLVLQLLLTVIKTKNDKDIQSIQIKDESMILFVFWITIELLLSSKSNRRRCIIIIISISKSKPPKYSVDCVR